MKGFLISVAILLFALSSCNTNDASYKSQNLQYKIYGVNGGSRLKYGVAIRALVKKYYNDSLLASPFDSIIRLIRLDSISTQASYVNALIHAKAGDSVVTFQRIDTSVIKEGLPDFAKHGNFYINSIKILEIVTDSLSCLLYQMEAEVKLNTLDSIIKKKEIELEDSILTKITMDVKVEKTIHGIYITKQRRSMNTFRKIQLGDKVTVDYKAFTFKDIFIDGSFDNSGKSIHPLIFTVGASEVIFGLDEGIRYFRRNESGRIYIPSLFAFGKSGISGKVKPNEIVYYDVNILSVQ